MNFTFNSDGEISNPTCASREETGLSFCALSTQASGLVNSFLVGMWHRKWSYLSVDMGQFIRNAGDFERSTNGSNAPTEPLYTDHPLITPRSDRGIFI